MPGRRHVPEPPVPLLPARTVLVPGRGEFFLRDSGGDGPPLLLLHGWTATADLNWCRQYADLAGAGWRVLALDHRGHGRGLRAYDDFRLQDCADDAAAVLRELGAGPAVVAGYSMGGPITLLCARRHPDVVRAIVLCATSSNWRALRLRGLWWSMAGFRFLLGIAPYTFWRRGLRALGMPDGPGTAWAAGELVRGSARDVAEAGAELGRFDARPWLHELRVPAAVVVTRSDRAVPPRWQRDLARRLGAAVVESPGDHSAVATRVREFNAALLEAIARVAEPAADRPVPAAPRQAVG